MRTCRKIVLFSLFLAMTAASFASYPQAAETDAANQARSIRNEEALKSPAGRYIQDLGHRAIKILSDQRLTLEQRKIEYHTILRDSFDVPTMGKFVAGRAWNLAAPEKQKEYLRLFEELLVKIYAERLASYKGEDLMVTGVRQESERDYVVSSEILHLRTGAPPTAVDWRVRKNNDKLAIVDVVIEGVSQSVSQREEYASIIHRDGGKLDALLSQMREQLQALNHAKG